MSHDSSGGLTGLFFGYDPGGNDKHGVAALPIRRGVAESPLVCTKQTAEHVLTWFKERAAQLVGPVLGLGVDTLTYWSGALNGDRQADRYLRSRYDEVRGSVIWPNSLYGAMSINGMFVLRRLRKTHSRLYATETHPKVLYYALSETAQEEEINLEIKKLLSQRDGSKLKGEKEEIDAKIRDQRNRRQGREAESWPRMNEWLSCVLGVSTGDASIDNSPRRSSHEWDALISAWAAYLGYESAEGRARWKNLAKCESASVVHFPVDGVEYRWPDESAIVDVKSRLPDTLRPLGAYPR